MNRIQVYTGEGKGKTTAALGLLLRFLGSGGKACLIQFDKGPEDGGELYSERGVLRSLEGLTLHATGLQRFEPEQETFRFKNIDADFAEAQRGLGLARQAIGQGFGLLVLDELLSLILTGLLTQAHIMALLDAYEAAGRPCELLITGHKVWPALEARVDLLTEMRKVKHYFDIGAKARKGIEY